MVTIFHKLTKRIFLIIKLNEVKYWKNITIVITLEELKYKLITKFFNKLTKRKKIRTRKIFSIE